MIENELNSVKQSNANYQNQDFIKDQIQYWHPQTMFKYTQEFSNKN